ncbi:MAG: hypothetical protein OXI07_03770 [Gammaproteobacteria bacterium]|nr:hypothetical protein [Gammaproteobacteria bacterium]
MEIPRRLLITALFHLGGGIAVTLGLVTRLPIIIPLALWFLIAGYTIREYKSDLVRWWKERRHGGPTASVRLSKSQPYDVIQYWNQSVLENLLKVPRHPKVVRMRDTGEIMEWSHPNPDYLRRKPENQS